MPEESAYSSADFGSKYEFCLEPDWWKEGVDYSEIVERNASPSPSALEQEFNERADRWRRQTGVQSSPTKRFLHEDYQIIMTMGREVIPLILKRLKNQPDEWFWALKHLARKDVAAGKFTFDEAAKAWLQWGITNGYITE
jgi:hypothetical protein